MTILILLLGLTTWAMWKKDIVLYLLAGLTSLLIGYRSLDTSSLDGVIQALPFIFLGIYMFIKIIVVQFRS